MTTSSSDQTIQPGTPASSPSVPPTLSTPPGPTPADRPTPPTRRRRLLIAVGVIVAVVLVGYGVWYQTVGRWAEGTDDAYANGNVVDITPQVAGTVVSIGADINDRVDAGKPLMTLDPNDSEVALDQAKANLAKTIRQVRGLYQNVTGQAADVSARRVDLARAQDDYNRRKGLAATGAIPAEELEHARQALASAQAAVTGSQQQLASTKALVDDTVISSHPDVQAAEATLKQAYLNNVRTTLVAPVSGYVAQRSAQVGQRVQPGTPAMAVVPMDQVWVDANFKETQLRAMRIGQPVEVTSDLYGSKVVYHGTVQGLGIGTGSAFSIIPAQNATGNWIKIVQRVPVRITLNPQELEQHPLRIGLSMDVSVNLHDQSGPALAPHAPTRPVLSTTVYEQQLHDADALIRSIVQANLPAGHPGR